MTHRLTCLALAALVLAQGACLPPPPEPTLTPRDSTGTTATNGEDPNRCPGRRVARVGIMTGVGVAGGWMAGWFWARVWGGSGAEDDPGARRLTRRYMLAFGAAGAVAGIVDAAREPCDVLPWHSRRTARHALPTPPPPRPRPR